MPRTYRIRGTIPSADCSSDDTQQPCQLIPGSARDGGTGTTEVPGDEVVRVVFDNGFTLWSRADDLVREHGSRLSDPDGEVWEFGPRPVGAARGSRGLVGLGIKVLEFLGIKVDATAVAARLIAEKAEAKLLRNNPPGLYRLDLAAPFALSALEADVVVDGGDAPMLVFLHGTASSAEGSFGKLWQGEEGAAARKTLAARYGSRVYALEHRSLTQSPIQNALDLVKRLPRGAQVDLVSHSRGGLVGELLCLNERDKDNDVLQPQWLDALFKTDRTQAEQLGLRPLSDEALAERNTAYQADRKLLGTLLKEMHKREIRVRRFVRVACPARGTTLASGRLDRWLSVLNFLTNDSVIGNVADFLVAVVKERTDPRTLPGLEAMMPGSALTRLLNHPGLKTQSDLSVIAGDIEGGTLWGQIKLLVSDWFYGAEHDLVVNTGSMYGGISRPVSCARFQFDQGVEVCHFNYFANAKSVHWLLAGLTRTEGDDGGFQPLQSARHEEPRWREAVRQSRAAQTPRPLAVVLPGIMGSALKVDDQHVWLNYWALARGGLGRMRNPVEAEPFDLLGDFYGPLLEFLARSHRVEIFPYDWRHSIRVAARKLADKLEIWLPDAERNKQPVHLVAHSLGGLVVRAMLADGERGASLWRRITALPNSRFLMLGTPNQGSYEAVRWLTGSNPTEGKLSLLDLAHSTDEIVNIVKDYPGVLELLPFDADSPDFSRQELWRKLKSDLSARWVVATATALSQARDTWDLLRQAPVDPRFMLYVAGQQPATVVDYQLGDYEEDWLIGRKRLDFMASARGDGTVTWKSGILPGLKAWYAEDTGHDELCSQKKLLAGYVDLLQTGTTQLLRDTPPTTARGAEGAADIFAMPVQPADDLPDEVALRSFGFGPSRYRQRDTESVVPKIHLSLTHGDLAYARHPVLVGHYQGDTIVSAESQLDARLGFALSRHLQLGLYPGPSRTHATFFNDRVDGKPAGALVVGLGQVGALSTTLLHSGVRDALLDYALRVAQWPDARFGGQGVRRASISCLLVGTGPGGLPLRDAIDAILRGAVQANERLEVARLTDRVLIDRIEFMEIFQDVALAAADALASIIESGEMAAALQWEQRVVEDGPGRRYRLRYGDTPGWWHRLEIIEEKSGGLRFIAATDRARAEVTQSTGQLRLADHFIRQVSQSPDRNAEVAKTLFEMLLPNALKELAPQQENLVLLLDETSAGYPWELLEDRWSCTGLPPAVAGGLIRQLKSHEFRLRPAHTDRASALVVGNPNLEGSRLFDDLPGARNEANKVENVLRHAGYRVKSCIDEKYPAILDALHLEAWRILHLAGHGVHEQSLAGLAGSVDAPAAGADECEPPARKEARKACVSGMVIGKHAFLTPGDVQQMRWVPELVFINCCHLGRSQAAHPTEYSRLAANLGVEFIRMGAKAVVAAGWAVDDAAASAFAESFYRHMLGGSTFGDAVRRARHDIWLRYGSVNTWGAYQCYGDPGFRLHGDGSAQPVVQAKDYYSPAELVADLENHAESIRVRARQADSGEAEAEALSASISHLLKRIPVSHHDGWLQRAEVAAALGFAYGEAGDWDQAVEWLEQAIRAPIGDCPVRAVEQCANFRVRRATERVLGMHDGASTPERLSAIADIEGAIDELDLLVRRAETPERLSLLGSACKRLASADRRAEQRRAALERMAAYLERAYRLDAQQAQVSQARPDSRHYTHWALARLLADTLAPDPDPTWRNALSTECRRLKTLAQARNEEDPGFWNAVAEPDCELVLMLADASLSGAALEAAADNIAHLYRNAGQRGASPREYATIREHLDFVLEIIRGTHVELSKVLTGLRDSL